MFDSFVKEMAGAGVIHIHITPRYKLANKQEGRAHDWSNIEVTQNVKNSHMKHSASGENIDEAFAEIKRRVLICGQI